MTTPPCIGRRRLVAGAAAPLMLPFAGGRPVAAQTAATGTDTAWPERPVRIVVPFPPAGTADILSRLLAERLGPRLPQPIVVDNRPGAGGTIAADIVAKARGDAHTLTISSFGPHGASPWLFPNVTYDGVRDFTHITLLGFVPMVIAVHPAQPYRTLPEWLDAARARPGSIRYAYGGNGTASHLVGLLLARAAGVELTAVPYRGSGPALTDAIGGQVEAIIETMSAAAGHFRAGRLRPIAISTPERSPALPDVATFREVGLGEATTLNWFGLSGPAGMPPAAVQRLLAEVRLAMAQPEVQERLAQMGVQPSALEGAAYTAFVTEELARWRRVIAELGVKAD